MLKTFLDGERAVDVLNLEAGLHVSVNNDSYNGKKQATGEINCQIDRRHVWLITRIRAHKHESQGEVFSSNSYRSPSIEKRRGSAPGSPSVPFLSP